MPEEDITRITVGNHSVSVIGLRELISRLASTHADREDAEIRGLMLDELQKRNYIPASASAEYGEAFVREFRKHLGQPYAEAARAALEIRVLGAGCAQCNKLEQLVMEVLTEIGMPADLEHVTDMREIARYGVMGVPALVIDGRVVSTGKVPPKDRVKSLIVEAASAYRAKTG